MRLTLAALLPLAVNAINPALRDDATALQKRQGSLFGALPLLFGTTFDNFPKLDAIRTETLPPKLRPDAKRIRISWGPVAAYSATDKRPNYVNYFPSTDQDNPSDTGFAHVIANIPTDITMLWARVDLENKAGESVASDDKGIYMHHLFFYQLNSDKIKKEFCYGDNTNWVGFLSRKSPNIMLGGGSGDHGAGEFFTTPDPKFNAGYYLPKDARFMVQGEVVNTFNTTQSLYPSLEIEYIPGKPAGLKDVSMMMFSVTNCTTHNPTIAVVPPKGKSKFDLTSDKFPLPEDGYIINAVGHMHDGGDRIEAILNGKTICDSKANYGFQSNDTMAMPMGKGGAGGGSMHMRRHGPEPMGGAKRETILSMTDCTNIIPVKKGDIVELKGYYDLDKHGGREANGVELGVMGIYVMYFAAKEKASEDQSASSWFSWRL